MLRIFGKLPQGAEWEAIRRSPNFNGSTFENPVPTSMNTDPLKVLKEYFQRDSSSSRPSKPVPLIRRKRRDFYSIPSDKLRLTWLGHASVLIETGGLRLLADGVFSRRVSPFSMFGPKRLHPAPIALEDLPPIDIALISHNHYDHLDMDLVDHLKDTETRFIAPLALGATLRYWGVPGKHIHELDWHDSFRMKEVRITATPARHFTNRGLADRNRTFWNSYVIDNGREKAFFCGDSGFFEGFAGIGERYGPMDVTMIGIGAYNRQWQAIHTDPAEAVEAHIMLRGKYLLPIHWCTFDLGLHSWSEPVERLQAAIADRDVNILLPVPGETVDAEGPGGTHHWWRDVR